MDILQSKSPSTGNSHQHEALHRAISECAYQLWEARGRPSGCADAIWLEAERLMRQSGAELAEHDRRAASGQKPKTHAAVAGSKGRRTKEQPGNQ